MSKASEAAIFAIKCICAAVIFICVIAAFYSVGPKLETAWWPVVSKLRINMLETTPEGWTKIRASFTKLRDCEYIGIAWFVGDRREEFERVAIALQRDPNDTGSPNRPLGTQRAGPWVIMITEKDFREKSFAQLFHRCHPFWNTVTEFYP